MNGKFPLASTAALVAEPARAGMLIALLNGQGLPAGELARAANVSAQSASMHLGQLLDGGFVRVTQQGRHRYYRLASPEIANALEALGAIAGPPRRKPVGEYDAIRYARTCYDHLAGILAVRLAESFERNGFLIRANEREYKMTPQGEEFLCDWQIDIDALRCERRPFARCCLDWTERRDHIAGALGAALYKRSLESGWIKRDRNSRIVHVTASGSRQFSALLG